MVHANISLIWTLSLGCGCCQLDTWQVVDPMVLIDLNRNLLVYWLSFENVPLSSEEFILDQSMVSLLLLPVGLLHHITISWYHISFTPRHHFNPLFNPFTILLYICINYYNYHHQYYHFIIYHVFVNFSMDVKLFLYVLYFYIMVLLCV